MAGHSPPPFLSAFIVTALYYFSLVACFLICYNYRDSDPLVWKHRDNLVI